jgi:spermidine synthase
MSRRLALVGCLVFSGLAALVYQVVWVRMLGFAFGTTTEAIGTVLAVFFGGMALGNALAARGLGRVERPLRLYALLELGIGAFALLSLPLLQRLDGLYGWVGADHEPLVMTAIRFGAAALVLLPPTIAMGATLPVVARGLVERDESLGRWSAILYTANTLGAVLGAYLCGFWLIPGLGLARTVVSAGLVNLGVAAAVLALAGSLRVAAVAGPHAVDPAGGEAAERRWFLAFFALSGFVAIGYEIVWSKVFSIVMEGTLYGFSAVLSAYLFGIGAGSLAIARWVDRVRDLPRLFGLLHVAIAASVGLGMLTVPVLPHLFHKLAAGAPGEAVNRLFLLVLPVVLVPTMLFGAAFPVLIRIYTRSAAAVGRGMGVATALNTAGSIASSLLVGFWWIPAFGIDATLYLLLVIDLAIGMLVLLGFQSQRGRERLAATASAALLSVFVLLAYDGVRVEQAVVGRWLPSATFASYRAKLRSETATLGPVIEGRNSLVTVQENAKGIHLRTNGMPEAGRTHAPPHYSQEARLLAILPYLLVESPERALVVGFGGGTTAHALTHTEVAAVEVVELEEGVIEAAQLLYPAGDGPLTDPRVKLVLNDGRNELLLARHRGERWDLIASQPSHPWLLGAANLFTEDFFRLVGGTLTEGGVFALWVNGFRTDDDSLLAIATSFERVFPGGIMVAVAEGDPRGGLVLLGGRRPLVWDVARVEARLQEPALSGLLADHGLASQEALLARVEGPVAAFASIHPDASNTDDNAFIEMRIPRRLSWSNLDFSRIDAALPRNAPVLPPLRGKVDVAGVAQVLLGLKEDTRPWPFARRLARLLGSHGEGLDPLLAECLLAEASLRDPKRAPAAVARLAALAEAQPDRPEPLRRVGYHHALRTGDRPAAVLAFEAAFERSGESRDAYDAARAGYPIDRQAAWRWAARIPAAQRAEFPRLALFRAEQALEAGASPDQLEAHYADLLRYRDTSEGFAFPGVDAVLAGLAEGLGDPTRARAHRDADREQRARAAAPLLAKARKDLAEGRIEEAAGAAVEARALLPGDAEVLDLSVNLALARDDTQQLEAALAALRRFAPSFDEGLAREHRIRARLERGRSERGDAGGS